METKNTKGKLEQVYSYNADDTERCANTWDCVGIGNDCKKRINRNNAWDIRSATDDFGILFLDR